MTLNKFIKWFGISVLIIGLFTIIQLFFYNESSANPPRLEHNQTNAATSTVSYLKPDNDVAEHATTTLSFLTNGADFVDLHLQLTPSSTESTIAFTVEFSLNNIDWAGTDVVIIDTFLGDETVHHASSTPDHIWRPATTTADDIVRRVMRFSDIQAEFMRFVFRAVDGTNAFSLWADAVTTIEKP